MEKVLNEVFDGKRTHNCVASNNKTITHAWFSKYTALLNYLEFLQVPISSKIECVDQFNNGYEYAGKLTESYYQISEKFSVYEPYFFFSKARGKPIFVFGKFYPYAQKQLSAYNAIVSRSVTAPRSKYPVTNLRVVKNLDISFDGYWADLVNHGDLLYSMMILHQNRFLEFSKKIEMTSEIKYEKIYTVIKDKEMAYKLSRESRSIRAIGTLFMLDKDFYEARAEIPENSWRAFVEDFFTLEAFPFTDVLMAGFNQVLRQAIKTVKACLAVFFLKKTVAENVFCYIIMLPGFSSHSSARV